jgi:adenylate kinase family enzyme
VLTVRDPLPDLPRRVLVAGTSGAGKTSLAERVSAAIDAPHTEIDGLFHGPGWVPRPAFAADVAELAAEPAWVTEWQYEPVRQMLLSRADLLVWLDLPRPVVMWRVTSRTVRRRLTGTVLWNGNLEPPLRTILTDRDHIVRWAFRTHPDTGVRVAAAVRERPELPVVRLTRGGQVDEWIDGPLRNARSRHGG